MFHSGAPWAHLPPRLLLWPPPASPHRWRPAVTRPDVKKKWTGWTMAIEPWKNEDENIWKHMKTCFFHGFEPWISWMMKFMAVERWTRQFHHEQIKVSPWKNGSLIRTNMDKWTLKHEQWINMRSNGGKCTFNHQASAWWKMRTFQSYLVCLRKKKIPWIYISWPVLDTLLFV